MYSCWSLKLLGHIFKVIVKQTILLQIQMDESWSRWKTDVESPAQPLIIILHSYCHWRREQQLWWLVEQNQKAPNHIIFRCYSTAETATKITRLGIHKTREAVVLPKARLFILLPVLGLNVIETVSISRTPMLSEQDKLDFRIWPCKQESGIQSRTQNSMLKTNLPINTGYREKKMRTGTGFSRNFTAALWNIKGSYTDFSYAFD